MSTSSRTEGNRTGAVSGIKERTYRTVEEARDEAMRAAVSHLPYTISCARFRLRSHSTCVTK